MAENQQSNSKTTLEKGGRDPPNVTLEDIAIDLSKYFKGFSKFKEYENKIEKKYDIRKQHVDDWLDDDIKRVWGKTQRLAKTSERRKCLSQMIILQLIKRSLDYSKVNAASEIQLLTPSKKNKQKKKKQTGVQKEEEAAEWQEIPMKKEKPMYIQIPLSVISDKLSESKPAEVQNVNPTYKLIDRVPNFTEIKKKKSYVMLYDNRTRNAAWVYEILNNKTVRSENNSTCVQRNAKINYKVDESIHEFYRASNTSLTPPYNRGHLAAAANHSWCEQAYTDTFLLSNISPQHKDLNKDIWEKLESRCRNFVKNEQNKIRNVHVYTGPLYLPTKDMMKYRMIKDKAVPTHFFKVIIKEYNDGTVNLECYKVPNNKADKKLKDYDVKIKEIEQDSGLIFTERIGEQGGNDSIRLVTWKEKIENRKEFKASTEVRITTPLTDYEDCAQSV